MYGLVDCNNFYCSCETLFNPKLQGKPVVVLSNNDGCVISRSEKAKQLGIEMGTPAFQMEESIQAHNIEVFSSNYELYGDISKRVMKTLSCFTPRMEMYSIDECFLDMHNMPYIDLFEMGVLVRKTVKQNIGIPVCVGIAPTKTLAKMANKFAKKNKQDIGVHYAADKTIIEEMLSHTAVEDVWGVGKQYANLLQKHGMKTALDVSRVPEQWIKENMTVVGQRLWNELNGLPAISWEEGYKAKKNICTGRSFGTMLTTFKDVKEALCNFAATVAFKLRKQNSCAKKVHVFLMTNTFHVQDPQYARSITIELDTPSNNSGTLIKFATRALEIIFRTGYKYKKVGIMVMDLVPDNSIQSNLFVEVDSEKSKKLMQVLDRVNLLFGKDKLRSASQGYEKKYQLRAGRKSPCYTTKFEDALKISK